MADNLIIEPLTYTKSWVNPEDFPTYEPDEAQVRADHQLLYDEIQTYINTILVPELSQWVTEAVAGIIVGQLTDGSVTLAKLNEAEDELQTAIGLARTALQEHQDISGKADASDLESLETAFTSHNHNSLYYLKGTIDEAIEALQEVATQLTNGMMSAIDKTKLDGIATGANNYVLPAASENALGGIKIVVEGDTLNIVTE